MTGTPKPLVPLYLCLLVVLLTACGDASRIMEPNTYRKCSEYSYRPTITNYLDLRTSQVTTDTVWVMTYQGKSVNLTGTQAERLNTDPTGVCKEVM